MNQQYVLFGLLLTVSLRIGLGRNAPGGRDFWLAYVSFNINFAWITVATMVNTAQVLQYAWGWRGAPLSPLLWAAILIVVAAAIGMWQVLHLNNLPFGVVVVWALGGIAIEQASTTPVLIAATVTTVLVGSAVVVKLARRRMKAARSLAPSAS